jgi:hypothetical protein
MTKNQDLYLTKSAHTSVAVFTNADSINTKKLLFSAGTYDSVIRTIFATSTNSGAIAFNFYLYDGVNYAPLCQLSITANAGNAYTVLPIDVLNSNYSAGSSPPFFIQKDMAGNKILEIPAGWGLYVDTAGVVAAGKQVSFIAFGEDY